MASKNLEVERDDFLNSLDSVIMQSDSEIEIVEEVTSRKCRKVKCGGLNKDLSFLVVLCYCFSDLIKSCCHN